LPNRALIDHANEVIDRLFALDEAVSTARAFRALLEDLNGRDLSVVVEPHISSITMVRAGLLRSAMGTVMACLDPEDRRGNRASVGQILTMLKDEHVAVFFPAPGSARDAASAALGQAKEDYKTLVAADLFGRGRRLRNDAIAHLLIPDKRTPTVEYEAIYQLHDAAERLVTVLYNITDRGQPDFPDKTAMLATSVSPKYCSRGTVANVNGSSVFISQQGNLIHIRSIRWARPRLRTVTSAGTAEREASQTPHPPGHRPSAR
jgi:hypothetical protein